MSHVFQQSFLKLLAEARDLTRKQIQQAIHRPDALVVIAKLSRFPAVSARHKPEYASWGKLLEPKGESGCSGAMSLARAGLRWT
jgi:hypothetical protein